MLLKKIKNMVRIIIIYWNYYFGSLDGMFTKVCAAGVF
jgi:hypothetical protein